MGKEVFGECVDMIEKILFPWSKVPRYPIFQGGMGSGISLVPLVSAVSGADAHGTLSSVGLDQIVSAQVGRHFNQTEAVEWAVRKAKESSGFVAVNIMRKLERSYEASVEGAVKGGADMIISGAGLPVELPSLVEKYAGKKKHGIALVPIVSSTLALRVIVERGWVKDGYAPPDAIVLAGPKSAGHLGFNYREIAKAGDNFLKEYDLFDVLLPQVLEYMHARGYSFPVLASGGIRTQADIVHALSSGAGGVHIGTPFVATHESGASADFKQKLIEGSNSDVAIGSSEWGSPAGMAFRYLITSPLAKHWLSLPAEQRKKHFCICCGLIEAQSSPFTLKSGDCPEQYVRPLEGNCPAQGNVIRKGLYTVSAEIDSITRIRPAAEIIEELVR